MTRFKKLSLLFVALGICGLAPWVQHSSEMRRQAVRPAELYAVIFQQIHAFQSADFSSAYQQVSTPFQERFSVDAFADLVRSDYPDLIRAHRIEFGSVVLGNDQAQIQVFFVLADGDVIPCLYRLVCEEGGWKIDSAKVRRRSHPGQHLSGLRT